MPSGRLTFKTWEVGRAWPCCCDKQCILRQLCGMGWGLWGILRGVDGFWAFLVGRLNCGRGSFAGALFAAF